MEPGSGPAPRLRGDPHADDRHPAGRVLGSLAPAARARPRRSWDGPGTEHAFGSSLPWVSFVPFVRGCVVSAETRSALLSAAGPRPSSHQLGGVVVALGPRVSGFKDAGAAASAQPSTGWVLRPRRRGSGGRRVPCSPALCWPRRWAFGDEGVSCDGVRRGGTPLQSLLRRPGSAVGTR